MLIETVETSFNRIRSISTFQYHVLHPVKSATSCTKRSPCDQRKLAFLHVIEQLSSTSAPSFVQCFWRTFELCSGDDSTSTKTLQWITAENKRKIKALLSEMYVNTNTGFFFFERVTVSVECVLQLRGTKCQWRDLGESAQKPYRISLTILLTREL